MRIDSLPFVSSLSPRKSLVHSQPGRTGLFRLSTWLCVAALAVFASTAAMAQVRDYSTIVVFGDSLSDTGNVTHLAYEMYMIPVPGPYLNYTLGRFTDGPDTTPHATDYFGVWIEQFAASLPSHPEVFNSLDGGTNYAYGYATTANGTSPLCFGTDCVPVENIGQQITDYLSSKHPKIDNHTLFVVWGGAIDLLDAASPRDVIAAAARQTLNIQRLIDAGGTQFLVPNLPPLGLVPRFNGSPSTALPATVASALFNTYLALGLGVLKDLHPLKKIAFYQLDVASLLRHVVAAPSAYSLKNVTTPAQGQAVDPDRYLFWDDLHPTTRGHNILANAAVNLMTP